MPSPDDRFNYNYADHPQWETRYPPWVYGYESWREYSRRLNGPRGELLLDKLPQLATRTAAHIPGNCPRVFISHRQADAVEALRLSQLVLSLGYNFWLDILNPDLLNIPNLGLPQQAEAIAMASVIEMGLLNCSHVLALITENTKGTLWVPYEYGRVKEPPPVTLQAGCRVYASYTDPLPEYLYLGPVLRSDEWIEKWLV